MAKLNTGKTIKFQKLDLKMMVKNNGNLVEILLINYLCQFAYFEAEIHGSSSNQFEGRSNQ